ncbi:unnamed protein product [Ectocarpus sp. CCAP 1310/34]|nr:unnamed protein product [Ectocarpus sp. CCAP 1310/34]
MTEVTSLFSVDLSAGNGGELTVTWFSPASRKKCRRSKYGRGVWSQEFLKEGNKLTADQGTESVEAVCFTFPSLLQSGKLPSAVWDAVEESVPTSSLEESDSDVEEEQGGEWAAGDPGGERSAIVQPPTAPPPERATTPIPNPRSSATPALRPPPAPGVLLTAAHFRPRRGQERTE